HFPLLNPHFQLLSITHPCSSTTTILSLRLQLLLQHANSPTSNSHSQRHLRNQLMHRAQPLPSHRSTLECREYATTRHIAAQERALPYARQRTRNWSAPAKAQRPKQHGTNTFRQHCAHQAHHLQCCQVGMLRHVLPDLSTPLHQRPGKRRRLAHERPNHRERATNQRSLQQLQTRQVGKEKRLLVRLDLAE